MADTGAPRGPGYATSLAFLASQVGARVAQLFGEEIEQSGISPREFAVLTLIRDSGPRTQQELADLVGMHRNNMVGLVDALEGAGLARRAANEADRRTFHVTVTDRGQRLLDTLEDVVPRIDARVRADLDDAEAALLRDLLRRVGRTLDLAPGVHPHLAGRPRRRAAAGRPPDLAPIPGPVLRSDGSNPA